MGVPCPGCGRSYDVTLFAFGRAIHCTCGRRVALEPRTRRLPPGVAPRFLADAMLGRLARWLRILGHDTAWEERASDEALVRRAIGEKRILLTRDLALAREWRIPDLIVIRAEEPLAQLAELAAVHDVVSAARLFRRCSICNTELVPAGRADARGRVPARVLARVDRFARCPGCDRLYWEGTHVARMRRVLEFVLRPPTES